MSVEDRNKNLQASIDELLKEREGLLKTIAEQQCSIDYYREELIARGWIDQDD